MLYVLSLSHCGVLFFFACVVCGVWRVANRVQLNGFVCAPFGNYEIELDVTSYSDAGSTMQQRTAWEIENGPDEVRHVGVLGEGHSKWRGLSWLMFARASRRRFGAELRANSRTSPCTSCYFRMF